jgi:hypothetical protein
LESYFKEAGGRIHYTVVTEGSYKKEPAIYRNGYPTDRGYFSPELRARLLAMARLYS